MEYHRNTRPTISLIDLLLFRQGNLSAKNNERGSLLQISLNSQVESVIQLI